MVCSLLLKPRNPPMRGNFILLKSLCQLQGFTFFGLCSLRRQIASKLRNHTSGLDYRAHSLDIPQRCGVVKWIPIENDQITCAPGSNSTKFSAANEVRIDRGD